MDQRRRGARLITKGERILHRYFIPTARIALATLLAGFALLFASPGAQAQTQDANKQIGDLVAEISVLSKGVCGVTAPTDADAKKIYDARKLTLTDDANQLIKLLDQQKPKGSSYLDKALTDQIAGWEKSLTVDPNDPKSCPMVPDDLQKLVSGGAPTGAVPTPSATPTPQVTVSAPNDFGAQTIGGTSDPQTITVTNSSGATQPLFVWYGTHLTNFKVTENTCDTLVPDKGSCNFKVVFAPVTMHAAPERLRVVIRDDWEVYEKVRRAYEDQGQAAVDEAARKVTELTKTPMLSTESEIEFCRSNLGGSGEVVKACNDLNLAIQNMNKLQRNIKDTDKKKKADVDKAADELRDKALAIIPLSGTATHWKYPLTRAVVGLDLSAVSSQTVRQAYFVDFNLLAPFKLPPMSANQDALESRWWFWLNPRITSLPKAADPSAISTIDEAGTFFTNFSNAGHTADIAQGFDVNGGVEMALLKPRDGIPWWGEYVNTQARLGISVIGGVGVATPFSIPDTDVTSQVNQSICDAFKAQAPMLFQAAPVSDAKGLVCTIPSGSTTPQVVVPNPAFDPNNPNAAPATVTDPFISFFTPERTRFFRRYYGGFRLKTYFFSLDVKGECDPKRKDRCDAPYDIFPGIIDVTVGKDEAVTEGKLSHLLFRVEGVYPLPFVPGFHIFGSIYTAFRGNSQQQPFNTFTVNSPTNGAANDANTFRFSLAPLDRDYFRVGVGVDLIQLLKHGKGGQPTTSTAANSDQGGSGGKQQAGSNSNPPSH